MRRLAPALVLVALALPAAATADDDPGNDKLKDADPIAGLPAKVTGDLHGAGVDSDEPVGDCADIAGSVWYRIVPGRDRRVVLRLQAQGRMEGSLEVYEQVRSSLRFSSCDKTDTNGNAAVGFSGKVGHTYLVRVARREGSEADGFSLNAVGVGAVELPGPALPRRGASATLDRLERTANAWSLDLTEGVRYRIALSHPGHACIGGALLTPHAGLDDTPIAQLGCDGYALVTVRKTGRYTLLVRAASGVRGQQPYRLQYGRGGADDSVPGRKLANYDRVHAGLDGLRTDRLDLYAFDVPHVSALFLRLDAAAKRHLDLVLFAEDGHELKCTCGGAGDAELRKGLQPGHYFVSVRAQDRSSGPYRLLRAVRTITRTHIALGSTTAQPGTPTLLSASVSPGVSGPVDFEVEQFDPYAHWQYVSTIRARAVGGIATASFVAPSDGRWRARATYEGTRGSARSITGFAPFTVHGPLEDPSLADG